MNIDFLNNILVYINIKMSITVLWYQNDRNYFNCRLFFCKNLNSGFFCKQWQKKNKDSVCVSDIFGIKSSQT